MRLASACLRHGANSSGRERLTAMTSGLSIASEGGEIWLSAVMRCSLEPPIVPMTIGVADAGRAALLAHRRDRRLRFALDPARVLGHRHEHLAVAVAERHPHVGRVQHRAHQHLEVLGLERGGDGAGEGAVRREIERTKTTVYELMTVFSGGAT